jgi:hypothetical protein
MKPLILASILCMALRAQEKTPPLAAPQIIDPADPFGLLKSVSNKPPSSLTLTFKVNAQAPSRVCSVPLLEAQVDKAVDPKIATSPLNSSVPMPQAKVPAPACTK